MQQSGPSFNPYAPPQADVARGPGLAPDEYELAGRGLRLLGAILDSLPAAIYVAALIYYVLSALEYRFVRESMEEVLLGLALGGLLLLAFQIFQWYLVAATGQSLAKRWLGMQIVRLDGTPPGFLHGVVLRSWILLAIAYIPYLGQLVALVDALMILGEERRCLHDHIAGTRVIVVSRA